MSILPLTSHSTNEKPSRPLSGSRFSRVPVTRLSAATTSQPRASRDSQRWEPTKPAPPVTSARRLIAADPPVHEADTAHAHRVVDVAAVDENRTPHRPAQTRHVQVAELVPLGDDDHGVGAGGHRVRVLLA